MSQHYPKPEDVVAPLEYSMSAFSLRKLKAIIERDGLIVPILVKEYNNFFDGLNWYEQLFEAADQNQSERVIACRELGFETILVETEWEEEDL